MNRFMWVYNIGLGRRRGVRRRVQSVTPRISLTCEEGLSEEERAIGPAPPAAEGRREAVVCAC